MSLRRSKSRTSVAYPTAGEFLARPNALPEHLPGEWRPLVAAGSLAVIFLIAGGGASGCSNDKLPNPTTSSKAAFSIVAPLFEHGVGRATTGCVVTSPPVFLTEEEARQIITEELAKIGIKFAQQDVTLKDVTVRVRKTNMFEQDDGMLKEETVFDDPQPMVVDLLDPDKNVAVEFISSRDHRQQWSARTGILWSVTDYDFKDAARELTRQLKEARTATRFGIFYDPTVKPAKPSLTAKELENKTPKERSEILRDHRRQASEVSHGESREHLRRQVRDFAAWLREQGVI